MYVFIRHLLMPLFVTPWFRLRVRGAENLPRRGPVLILPNHTSALDPWWVGYQCRRPAWYMASAQLFRMRFLGWFIGLQGAFPKQKFVRDDASADRVKELVDNGQPVVIFPEGSRTFDGRNEHVRDGIGRFVRELGYPPVVFCRVASGHLWRPRWATSTRLVPVHLEYSEPFDFSGSTDEEIVAVVRQQIVIDGDRFAREGFDTWTWGRRLAEGLPAYLWACPACLEPEGLRVTEDGNGVACRACGAAWTLEITNRLVAANPQTEDLTVSQAYDRLEARYGRPPVLDRAVFECTGVVLEGRARIGRVGDTTTTELVAEGLLRLSAEALSVHEGERELWRLPLTELRAASLEIHNLLQLRKLDGELLQLDPADQSTLLWEHFITPWNRQARGKPI